MQLVFLGTGSAFTIGDGNWQSNILLVAPSGKKLLIDCGGDIRFSLHEQGLSIADIDAVYISHCHADHVGGMEWFGFGTYFNPSLERPVLFGNERVIEDLWCNTLRGGMGSIQGKVATLETYFDARRIEKNKTFVWEGVEFHPIQMVHIRDGYDIVPSYGLIFEVNGKTYFITTDTQFSPNDILDFYNSADLIFQDCETAPFKSGVHAHFNDLKTLAPAIKAKMWLYHYQPGTLPDAEAEGFAGFARKGQVFDL